MTKGYVSYLGGSTLRLHEICEDNCMLSAYVVSNLYSWDEITVSFNKKQQEEYGIEFLLPKEFIK